VSTAEFRGDAKPGVRPAAPPAADREGEPPAPRRRSPVRRIVTFLLLLMLLAAAGFVGTSWWLTARHFESTDDAFVDAHMAGISPQIGGRVLQVPVDDNEDVAQGQLLVLIDPADYQARVDQTLALRAAAAGGIAQAKAQFAAAEANVEEAEAEVGVAQANATNAAVELKREQALEPSHAVSRQAYDTAVANAKSTAATLVAAQKKKAAAEAQVGVAKSQIDTADANLKSAEAQLAEARLQLSYTKVTAPAAGHIAHKSVTPGDYVQVGQSLMALVPHEVWVTAYFKETQLADMAPGQPTDVSVDGCNGRSFKAHVDSIQRGGGAAFSLLPAENATGNYIKVVQRVPVKIVFDGPVGPDCRIGPGMSVVPTVKVR
jgi:membrane fusion protein, multidrug efflux system